MMSRKSRLRFWVQLTFLIAAGLLLWPALPWESAPKLVAQASAFTTICSVVALKAFSAGMLIGFGFAILALWKRRLFCRYACPVGLLVELATRFGYQNGTWWRRCPPLGQYAALATAIGAVVGYPLFAWTDPLAIFSSAFSIPTAEGLKEGILAGFLLGILILLSLAFGSLWCARLCPLGGTQDLLFSVRSLFSRRERAVGKLPAPEHERRSPWLFARRTMILGATGIAMGIWAKKLGAARGENAPLRPPGASEEDKFAGLCIRCGNCARVCPSKIIHPDTHEAGLAGLLAPKIRYEKDYCLEECNACNQVCPSGALQELELKLKHRWVIGEALVDGSLCVLVRGERDCDACERSCSFEAVHIYWDEERYIAYPLVNPDKCNGCGACEVACPTNPIKAVRVWRRTDLQFTISDQRSKIQDL